MTPLFWDLHIHGVAGIDFMHATTDEMAFACEDLGKHGIGVFAPTLLTAEPALLAAACERWGTFIRNSRKPGYLPRQSAVPLGLHLEGPFLSPRLAGAHPPRFLSEASLKLAKALIDKASGQVAIVTLAPELQGALKLAAWLAANGIRVQMGHTEASAAQALAAAKHGFTGITHLYNAVRIHHRDPGVLAPLKQGLVTAELITDGHHLDATFVAWCVGAAPQHVYAVSDGCAAIGCKRHAKLTLGSLLLRRQGDVAVVARTGTLAGGATYLTQHPQRLNKQGTLAPKAILPLFYRLQTHLFGAHVAPPKKRRNHFHPANLRFLGTD